MRAVRHGDCPGLVSLQWGRSEISVGDIGDQGNKGRRRRQSRAEYRMTVRVVGCVNLLNGAPAFNTIQQEAS